MLQEIEISLISTLYAAGSAEKILNEFETQFGMRVGLQKFAWDTAWGELIRYSIYKNAPDVSEVGSTWIGDLIGLDNLRPFTPNEISSIGGAQAFYPSAWNSGVGSDGKVWAIPWLIDSRLLYYRRDILEKAGINPSTAFQTHQALVATLEGLKQAGVEIPWIIPTSNSRMSLHNLSSWVWGAGGQFVSADGKRALFATPEALEGFRQYFELSRFLPPQPVEAGEGNFERLFLDGRAAVTLSGPWLLNTTYAEPELIANTGVTFPPGVPFIGGSSLVMWQSSKNIKDALSLIRFLTSQHVQQSYLSGVGLLPARLEALPILSRDSTSITGYIRHGLQVGRSFPLLPLWGLVEERLCAALSVMWQKILSDADIDLAELIERDLGLLARRLDLALNGR